MFKIANDRYINPAQVVSVSWSMRNGLSVHMSNGTILEVDPKIVTDEVPEKPKAVDNELPDATPSPLALLAEKTLSRELEEYSKQMLVILEELADQLDK